MLEALLNDNLTSLCVPHPEQQAEPLLDAHGRFVIWSCGTKWLLYMDTLGDVALTSADGQYLKAIGPSSLYTMQLSPTRLCDYNAWGVLESSELSSRLSEARPINFCYIPIVQGRLCRNESRVEYGRHNGPTWRAGSIRCTPSLRLGLDARPAPRSLRRLWWTRAAPTSSSSTWAPTLTTDYPA